MMTCDDAWTEAEAGALELAERSEFWRRTAISRVYYAVYHRTGRLVGIDPSGANSNHQRLLDAVKAAKGKEWVRAGIRLKQLQLARVKADYYLGNDITRQDVVMALENARAVRQLLSADEAGEVVTPR